MRLPGWLRSLLGLVADKAIDKLGEAVNAPEVRRPRPGPDVKPITDADRGRPPRGDDTPKQGGRR